MQLVLQQAATGTSANFEVLNAPILLTSALAFMARAELQKLTVGVTEDTTRTGASLQRHNARLEDAGVGRHPEFVCFAEQINRPDRNYDDHRPDPSVFLTLSRQQFRRNVGSLTALINTMFQPPEIGHHLFRCPNGSAVLRFLRVNQHQLSKMGEVRWHYASRGDQVTGVTILCHPGVFTMGNLNGLVKCDSSDGVHKLRLYLDEDLDELRVVPMSYPSLKVQSSLLPDSWGQVGEPVRLTISEHISPASETLLKNAQGHADTLDLVYRVVRFEIELMILERFQELALLGEMDSTTFAQPDPEIFAQMYGHHAGLEIVDSIKSDGTMRQANVQRARATFPVSKNVVAPPHPLQPTLLSIQVPELAAVTSPSGARASLNRDAGAILDELSGTPDLSSNDPTNNRMEGKSFGELLQTERLRKAGSFRVSNAIDYLLAVRWIIPFFWRTQSGGWVELRRRYRLSEKGKRDRYPTDYVDEILGVVVAELLFHSPKMRRRGVSQRTVHKVMGVLEPVFARDGIPIVMQAGPYGPVAAQSRGSGQDHENDYENLFDREPVYLTRLSEGKSGGFIQTPKFDELYERGELILQEDERLSSLQQYLKAIASLIESSSNTSQQLLLWAMITPGRLGLEYVSFNYFAGLQALTNSLNMWRRGTPYGADRFTGNIAQARHSFGVAHEKLSLLRGDFPQLPFAGRLNAAEIDLRRQTKSTDLSFILYRFYDAINGLMAGLADAIQDIAPTLSALSSSISDDSLGAKLVDIDVAASRAAAALCGISIEQLAAHWQQFDLSRQGAEFTAERMDAVLKLGSALGRGFLRSNDVRQGSKSGIGIRNTRVRYVLSADIIGSTKAGGKMEHNAYAHWKNDGLNTFAGWGAAFLGRQFVPRQGDNIKLEFESGTPAVIAACLTQRHIAAARAVSSLQPPAFRVTVDVGEISDGDGENIIGHAIDVAATVGSNLPEGPWAGVVITGDVAGRLSERLRDCLTVISPELGWWKKDNDPPALYGVDVEKVLEAVCQDVETAAASLRRGAIAD